MAKVEIGKVMGSNDVAISRVEGPAPVLVEIFSLQAQLRLSDAQARSFALLLSKAATPGHFTSHG